MEDTNKSRKRVTQACDPCSKKRRKCDGTKPVCTPCETAGRQADCSYSKPAKRRGPAAGYSKLATQASEQLKHLQILVVTLMQLHPEIASTLPDLLSSNPASNRQLVSEDDFNSFWPTCSVAAWLETKVPFTEDNADDDAKPRKRRRDSAGTSLQQLQQPSPLDSGMYQQQQQSTEFAIPSYSPASGYANVFASAQPDFRPVIPVYGHHPNWSTPNLPPIQSPSSISSATPSGFEDLLGSVSSSHTNIPLPPIRNNTSMVLPAADLTYGPTSNASLLSKSSHPLHSTDPVSVKLERQHNRLRLPEDYLMVNLLDTYFQDSFHSFLPILDKQHVLTWSMESGARQSASTLITDEGMRSELLFAIFALALPHLNDKSAATTLTVSGFIEQAEYALSLALKAPSLSTVQALVILSCAYLNEGRLSEASAASALAVSLASDLGMNNTSAWKQEDNRIYVCRTFWGAYVVDILVSLRIGKVTSLRPSQIDLPLPSTAGPEEVEMWRSAESYTFGSPKSMGTSQNGNVVSRSNVLSTFVEMIKLCLLLSDLCMRLNAPKKMYQLTDGVPELSIIHQQLLHWEHSVSPSVRLQDNVAAPLHKVELQLLYLTALTLVRRPRSNESQLEELCEQNIARTLTLLESRKFSRSRPVLLEYCVLTVAATCQSPTVTSEPYFTQDHLQACLRPLSHLTNFPAIVNSTATVQSLPVSRSAPQLMDAAMESDQVSAYANSDSTMASVFNDAGANSGAAAIPSNNWFDSLPNDANNIDMGVLDSFGTFDIASWTSGDEVLNWLGVRGETRPSSPVNGADDLLNRYQSQIGTDSLWG